MQNQGVIDDLHIGHDVFLLSHGSIHCTKKKRNKAIKCIWFMIKHNKNASDFARNEIPTSL